MSYLYLDYIGLYGKYKTWYFFLIFLNEIRLWLKIIKLDIHVINIT